MLSKSCHHCVSICQVECPMLTEEMILATCLHLHSHIPTENPGGVHGVHTWEIRETSGREWFHVSCSLIGELDQILV